MKLRFVLVLVTSLIVTMRVVVATDEPVDAQTGVRAEIGWHAGFSIVEITPTEPMRLSGYADRGTPHTATDSPLFVRVLALTAAEPSQRQSIHLLLSIDTIGMPAGLTKQIQDQVRRRYQIPAAQVVVAATHTHSGPHLDGGLINLFDTPLSDAETSAAVRYRERLMASIDRSIDSAVADMQPVTLHRGRGEIDFAVNRRVLTDGKWTGFGRQADGPVDHRVDVLQINGVDGRPRGTVFNYACHCTSISPEINHVDADWAGYAARQIEQAHPGSVALCTIGCAGDANPEPRGQTQAAMMHGRRLGEAIAGLIGGPLDAITAGIDARSDYASLEFELPTIEELRRDLDDPYPQQRRRAAHWIDVYQREGRLPATYPVPVGAWIFGDQLTMVFLGGEVVIDYAIRLRRELDDPDLWVSAYCNDVMGYVCSERMRGEGGYEFDRSTLLYNLPGPWASGSEDRLITRVTEMIRSGGRSRGLSPEQSMREIRLSPGYRIELVASEPLVVDPINLAFGDDGRLWVVEMGDYPEGDPAAPDGGGRIKVLADHDGDGRMDHATTFLSGLEFPTGVFPWGDGVIVASAPDVFYAADTDGDDVADVREVLYSGFALANPQHRINGFTYALDHSLHLASGDNLGELLCRRVGRRINASGHDVQIYPDSGELALVSGRSQYIRGSNVWGEWFGSENPRPSFHYVIDQRHAALNPHVSQSRNSHELFRPAVAAPVYPAAAADERFNDVSTANRFTSACSSIIVGGEFGDGRHDAVIVCEPVHQLVHRSLMIPTGATYQAVRGPGEQDSEFLASRDAWFRPVRVLEGPDRCLWVVDMYRESIEHPEWIPQSWQQQLDLRAGSDRGRIYRVVPESVASQSLRDVADLRNDSLPSLIERLNDPSRPRREAAHRRIIHIARTTGWDAIVPPLARLIDQAPRPETKVHAFHLLAIADRLDAAQVTAMLRSEHFGCQMVALTIIAPWISHDEVLASVAALSQSPDGRVRCRVAVALADVGGESASVAIATLCQSGALDEWTARGVSLGLVRHGRVVADALCDRLMRDEAGFTAVDEQLLQDALATMTATGTDVADYVGRRIQATEAAASFRLAAIFAASRGDREVTRNGMLVSLYQEALPLIGDDQVDLRQRCRAMTLVGIGLGPADREHALLLDLLSPDTPLEIQELSIDRLARADEGAFATDVIGVWDRLSGHVRDVAIHRLLTRNGWQGELIDALERGAIRISDLTPATRQQLRVSGSRSMQVRVERLLGSSTSSRRDLVQTYLTAMEGPGDRVKGEALYNQHCGVCHQPQRGGDVAVGPSLQNLTNLTRLHLVQSILDPNAAVDPKYQSYAVQTSDGRVVAGVIEEESSDRILLATADGKRDAIRRDEIELLKNNGVSLMPEGFEQVITPQQMGDLVAYLSVR